jgi:hypothetical protein
VNKLHQTKTGCSKVTGGIRRLMGVYGYVFVAIYKWKKKNWIEKRKRKGRTSLTGMHESGQMILST